MRTLKGEGTDGEVRETDMELVEVKAVVLRHIYAVVQGWAM